MLCLPIKYYFLLMQKFMPWLLSMFGHQPRPYSHVLPIKYSPSSPSSPSVESWSEGKLRSTSRSLANSFPINSTGLPSDFVELSDTENNTDNLAIFFICMYYTYVWDWLETRYFWSKYCTFYFILLSDIIITCFFRHPSHWLFSLIISQITNNIMCE